MGACPSCGFENAANTYFCGRCQLYLRPLGAYQLVRPVGKGGFASVFEAHHRESGAIAAVKILHREYLDRDDVQQRFAREAQVMKELDHPFVVSLYDYGELSEEALGVYLVMEWCDGRTLHQAMQEAPHRRFAPMMAKRYTEQLLEGLHHIHGKGIVHRDLKPGNLMLVKSPQGIDQIKILDFGLAWIDGKALTRSDVVIGSLLFMAPEQIRGRKDLYGPSTDLYAVGLLLAWMLTGAHIFGDVTREQIMVHHVLEEPPSLADMCPEIRWSPSLESLLERALHKDPMARFGSAAEMLEALSGVEWPDFARAETMPVMAFSEESAQADLSPFDETGALEPFAPAASTPPTRAYGERSADAKPPELTFEHDSIGDISAGHEDEGASWAELEGAHRPTRGERGRPMLWLVLVALLGLGVWGGLQLSDGRRAQPVVAKAPDAAAGPEAAPSTENPTPRRKSVVSGTDLPAWVRGLLDRWQAAWKATADKPYVLTRKAELKAFYHRDFRDVTKQRDRDATVDAMVQKGQNSSWMQIDISEVYVRKAEPDFLIVQLRRKCYRSTMRAQAGDLTPGSMHKENIVMMLEWKKVGSRWQLYRSRWHPVDASGLPGHDAPTARR